MRKIETATCPIDGAFEEMLICAERYACGRRSYVVNAVVSYIQPLLPCLSTKTLAVFHKNMQAQHNMAERSGIQKVWGDTCDRRDWMEFWDAVKLELQKRRE